MKARSPMADQFTASEVVRITGVKYQTLNHWARIGLVRPSILSAKGSGSRRGYDFQDLVSIRVALKWRRAGIFGPAIARILRVLRQIGFETPTSVAIKSRPGVTSSLPR